jgi:hypothetical protein
MVLSKPDENTLTNAGIAREAVTLLLEQFRGSFGVPNVCKLV